MQEILIFAFFSSDPAQILSVTNLQQNALPLLNGIFSLCTQTHTHTLSVILHNNKRAKSGETLKPTEGNEVLNTFLHKFPICLIEN